MRKLYIAIAVVGLAGLTIFALLVGCGKKPTEPVAAKEYPLYFIGYKQNGVDYKYYRYLPYSEQLDSFVLPVIPYLSMSASADGGQLWISNRDSLYVCDVESESIIAALNYDVGNQGMAFSPDNSMAAIMRSSLKIISTTDYTVIFEDTGRGPGTKFSDGRFSPDGKSFFCGSNPGFAYNLDISNGFQSEWIDITTVGSTRHAFQLPNSDNIATLRWIWGDKEVFAVYSPALDSVLFSYSMTPPPAYMRLSPDGKSIYLTAAGDLFSLDYPKYSYAIYDIATRQIEEVLIQVDFPDANYQFFPLDKVYISPDGRWLSGVHFPYRRYLSIHDLHTKDSLKSPIVEDKYFGYLTIQQFP